MTDKERYYYRKENNICVKCGKAQSEKGKTRCRECAEKGNKEQRDNCSFLKDMGICTRCNKEKADIGYKHCLLCRLEEREEKKRQYANNEEKAKKIKKLNKDKYYRLKEQGLCARCGKPRESNKVLCNKCSTKDIIRKRKKRYQNSGILRSERKNYGECYICSSPICKESESLCERCLENARKNIRIAHENTTQGMLKQRERWKKENGIAFGWKVTYEEMNTS